MVFYKKKLFDCFFYGFNRLFWTLLIILSFSRCIKAEWVQVDYFLDPAWAFNAGFPPRSSLMPVPVYCSHYILESGTLSQSAKILHEQGWPILADISLARWQFVVIAQEILPETSGICTVLGGKLVIYNDENLLGFVSADNTETLSIGGLELQEGPSVRLYSGTSLLPIADLIMTNIHQLALRPPSLLTSHCQGKAIFPNIYGKDIKEARDYLFELDWKPKYQENLNGKLNGPAELKLINAGFTEVVTCSGTGYGRCVFEYEMSEVAELQIITWGSPETLIVAKDIWCFGSPVSYARSPNVF